MTDSVRRNLLSVEALRGVAAVAVVLSHSARHLDKAFGAPILISLFQAGHTGVDLFFVISGFIILFVHQSDVGKPKRLANYARRRITRVLPLYWIAFLTTLLMASFGANPIPSTSFLLWSAFLLPTQHEPFLGIAWTLQYEMVFYVVFAAVIANRGFGVILFLIWLGCIILTNFGILHQAPTGPLSGIYGIEFFFGMTAARIVQQNMLRSTTVSFAFLMGGFAVFGATLVMESAKVFDGFASPARLVYGASAAVGLIGAAILEQKKQFMVPSWLSILGGSSYSIYLFQFVFIGTVWQVLLRGQISQLLPHFVLFALLALSAVIGGVLASRFIEKPLLRLVRPR